MPIFVRWKWIEKTKSYLVIFHFDNDYSKPNLRTQKMKFEGTKRFRYYVPAAFYPEDFTTSKQPVETRNVMTWAPSHLELGLLMEILTYANIVNGLSLHVRKELREKLETFYDLTPIIGFEDEETRDYFEDYLLPGIKLWDKMRLIGEDMDYKEGRIGFVCFELCPEYLDYLRNILRPYLK